MAEPPVAMKKVVIMYGLPGSGKTKLAHQLYVEYHKQKLKTEVLSLDDYWYVGAEYCFKKTLLGHAIAWNVARLGKAILSDMDVVIVDDVNLSHADRKPYENLASEFGYVVEYRRPSTAWCFDIGHCWKMNRHGLTEERLTEMLNSYEEPPAGV